jgi:hypothetical protein
MTNQPDVLATIEANLQQAMQRKKPREQVKDFCFRQVYFCFINKNYF